MLPIYRQCAMAALEDMCQWLDQGEKVGVCGLSHRQLSPSLHACCNKRVFSPHLVAFIIMLCYPDLLITSVSVY